MNRKVVIKFFAPVVDVTVNALLNAVDQKLRMGIDEFKILISSPGGSVFHGLSAYNYLKGIPAKIITHNFGSVDSIGIVMFCAGDKRLSVPQARFLLHSVRGNFKNEALEEKQIEERLKGIKIDIENIAKIISENTGKSKEEIIKAMTERTTLNPEEGEKWGLVDEISPVLFSKGSEIISIQFQSTPQPPRPSNRVG
ncbi:ATP-dependent Clp protease proteolytic subunit [bacterium]|nr:ATP-dependent Clp protease proteolytic subunit [bacterium]